MCMETPTTKYIFDLGANAGQNLSYYLSRADVVVAVEANPILCDEIKVKFRKEIHEGCLFVENCVLTDSKEIAGKDVDFFVHREFSVFSRLEVVEDSSAYKKVRIGSTTASELVRKYLPKNAAPYYIKIDVEGYDSRILRELFQEKIYPEFISAESYDIETFSSLVDSGAYRSFNLVEGSKVHLSSWADSADFQMNFSHHSAGPFGSDLKGNWFDASTFFQILALEGLGWKDIHASVNLNNCLTTLDDRFLIKKVARALFFLVYRFIVSARLRKVLSRTIHLSKLFISKH